MAMVRVVFVNLYRRTHSLSRLAWSGVGGRLAPYIKWTGWTLAMALPWWQHHKHCLGYYYNIIIITRETRDGRGRSEGFWRPGRPNGCSLSLHLSLNKSFTMYWSAGDQEGIRRYKTKNLIFVSAAWNYKANNLHLLLVPSRPPPFPSTLAMPLETAHDLTAYVHNALAAVFH